MNREEAAREIDNTACCFSDKRFRDAMHMAAAALRGQRDTTTTSWYSKKLYCDTCGERIIGKKHNYCPMCGRKLEVEG